MDFPLVPKGAGRAAFRAAFEKAVRESGGDWEKLAGLVISLVKGVPLDFSPEDGEDVAVCQELCCGLEDYARKNLSAADYHKFREKVSDVTNRWPYGL